jgi:alpha-glucosidase (family GH31 glycosyl hydrolase)
MNQKWNRREVLKGLVAASTALVIPSKQGSAQETTSTAAQQVEIQISSISAHTLRLSMFPLNDGAERSIPSHGSLVQESWGPPAATLRAEPAHEIALGNLRLKVSFHPVNITVTDERGNVIQQFAWDENTGVLSFLSGSAPLFGLGEGGPQFDRRGSTDPMRSGQGGYKLATHGGRVPIPWIIGASGWAIFFHQPFGTFDLTGTQAKFQPVSRSAALPLDLFFVASSDPATIMAEYARLTGHAEMPPLWSFGYQQSHRTLASHEEVLAEAKTFREKNCLATR